MGKKILRETEAGLSNELNSVELVVSYEHREYRDRAVKLAEHVGAPLQDGPGTGLTLMAGESGLFLLGYGMRYQQNFEQMLRRVDSGHIQHEMLAKAAKTNHVNLKAVDATAGMGEDALLLAACGYDVTMFEQNPVIAALLQDALCRAAHHPVLGQLIQRMHLIEGDSISYLNDKEEKYDLVYLDPMFPARQKSGLIHKKLQLIQKLEHPCVQEGELFAAALVSLPGKIIVKRPLKGPYLAGRKPGYSIRGKAIRYDCYVPFDK